MTAGGPAAGNFTGVIDRRRALQVFSALAGVIALVVAGCGGGSSGNAVKKGLTTLVDGNVTCAEHVKGGATGAAGATSVKVDGATLGVATPRSPVAGGGPLKGSWLWPASAVLTAERSVFGVVDPGQTGAARLLFDPADRKSDFASLSQTTRFAACFDSQLNPEGEKPTPMTRFSGSIVTRARKLCLRLRVLSERNNDAAELVLPLGRKCDGA